MKKLTRLFFILMTITFMPLLIWASCTQQDRSASAPSTSAPCHQRCTGYISDL